MEKLIELVCILLLIAVFSFVFIKFFGFLERQAEERKIEQYNSYQDCIIHTEASEYCFKTVYKIDVNK